MIFTKTRAKVHHQPHILHVLKVAIRPSCYGNYDVITDPFYWAWLPMAEKVFSQETKDLVIPKLESPGFIDGLQDELLDLFSVSICVIIIVKCLRVTTERPGV